MGRLLATGGGSRGDAWRLRSSGFAGTVALEMTATAHGTRPRPQALLVGGQQAQEAWEVGRHGGGPAQAPVSRLGALPGDMSLRIPALAHPSCRELIKWKEIWLLPRAPGNWANATVCAPCPGSWIRGCFVPAQIGPSTVSPAAAWHRAFRLGLSEERASWWLCPAEGWPARGAGWRRGDRCEGEPDAGRAGSGLRKKVLEPRGPRGRQGGGCGFWRSENPPC